MLYDFIRIHNVIIYAPSITNVKVDRDWWGRPRLLLTYGHKKKSIRFDFQDQEDCDAALTLVETAIVECQGSFTEKE
jgi:hypothetical protein